MSLAATLLTEARLDPALQRLDRWENRNSEYGLYAMAVDDTPNLVPAQTLADLKTSFNRPVSIPVFDRTTIVPGTTISCNPVGVTPTSALVPVTWQTRSFTIRIIPIEHDNNEMSLQMTFNQQLNAGIRGVTEAIENDIFTVLDNNRTQNLNNDLSVFAPFNPATDQIEIPQTSKDQMWSYMRAILGQNDYTPNYHVVNSWGIEPEKDFYVNQGAGNAANTAFQFADLSFYRSNRVVNAGNQGTGFIMPMSAIAWVPWVNNQARRGGQAANGSGLKRWSVANVPGIGDMALLENETCADVSATISGATAAQVLDWEYSIEYALPVTYNSDIANTSNAIVKFVLQN